jgi:hypothetical protein
VAALLSVSAKLLDKIHRALLWAPPRPASINRPSQSAVPVTASRRPFKTEDPTADPAGQGTVTLALGVRTSIDPFVAPSPMWLLADADVLAAPEVVRGAKALIVTET